MRRVFIPLSILLVLAVVLHLTGGAPWSDSDATGETRSQDADALDGHGNGSGASIGLEGRAGPPSGDPDPSQGLPRLPAPVNLDAERARGALHGRVVDGDGAPVPGVRLTVATRPWRRGSVLAHDGWYEEEQVAETRSARDGSFSLAVPPGVDLVLHAHPTDFAPQTYAPCRAGQRRTVVLSEGVAITVRARSPEDDPLPGVSLELHGRQAGVPVAVRREGQTDEKGIYRFAPLPRNVRWTVEGNDGHLGGWTWQEPIPAFPGAETTFDLVIQPGRQITGRITDAATGAPLEGALVGMGWTFHKRTRTDAEGRYALGGWTGNGYLEVNVLAPGYARGRAAVGRREVVDVALRRGFSVTGRLERPDGTPAGRAPVAVVGSQMAPGSGQTLSTAHGRTDDQGRFRLTGLSRDLPHTLVALAPGTGRHLTEFDAPTADEAEVDLGVIRLPIGRLLRGRVLHADGTPWHDDAVYLQGANPDAGRLRPAGGTAVDSTYGRSEDTRPDADGHFAFADLAPGTYTLQAGETGPVATATVIVPATGPVPAVQLRFAESRALVVEVVTATGEPVEDATVWCQGLGASEDFLQTDDQGRVTFRLPPHVTRAVVEVLDADTAGDGAWLLPDEETVDVTDTPARIVLPRGDRIRGRLVSPSGEPIQRGHVLALRDDTLVGMQWTAAGGAFDLTVAPGPPVTLVHRGDVFFVDGQAGYRRVREAWSTQMEDVSPGGPPVVLRAAPHAQTSTLTVRVVTPEGAPTPGVAVEASPAPSDRSLEGTSDAQGRVRFRGLSAQPVRIVATPDEDKTPQWTLGILEAALPGETVVEVVLSRARILEGVVQTPEGLAVPQANVVLRFGRPAHRRQVQADGEGRFRFRIPAEGDPAVSLWAFLDREGAPSLHGEVQRPDAGSDPIVLVIQPRAR